MSTLSIPNTATALTTILSADFNGNFAAVSTWANGNITNSNFGSMTGPITWAVTSNVLSISSSNVGTEGTAKWTHSGVLAASKAALWITSSAAQTTGHALLFVEQLSAAASIPALKVSSTAAAAGALSFDVSSTTAPSRPVPTLTTAQKASVSSPATGAKVYDSTLLRDEYYDGASWRRVGDSPAVVTKLTTYAATTADEIILCNTTGGAWTLTLPAPGAANAGKRFRIRKITADLNKLSITYTGVVGSPGIWTKGEELELYSDGSAYQTLSRHIPSNILATYTPTFGAGFGTVSAIDFYYRRVGSYIEIRGTATAGTVGAGAMSVTLPSGLVHGYAVDTVVAGNAASDYSSAFHMHVIATSGATGQVSFGQASGRNGVSPIVGNTNMVNGSKFSMSASLYISTWDDAGIF